MPRIGACIYIMVHTSVNRKLDRFKVIPDRNMTCLDGNHIKVRMYVAG